MPYKDPEQERAFQREYYQKTKEKQRAYQREWYKKNKEKKSEYYHKNKEKVRVYNLVYQREWYKKNKEKKREYYDKNKDRINKMHRVRKKNNPALALQHIAKRRAMKKRAIPAWLRSCPVEKRRVYTVYLLSRLLAKADGIERHVDHMVPLSDGGPHWSGNLQILTKTQNLEKGAYSCPKLKKQMKLNLKEAKVLYAKAA